MCRRFGTLSTPSVVFFLLGDFPAFEFCADVSGHSGYCICCILYLGWLPGVWILCADFSGHCLFHLLYSFSWVIPRRLNFMYRSFGTQTIPSVVFSWVIPRRLNFMCRCFGTLYSIYCNLSLGWFLSVWILCADVSGYCQFHFRTHDLWRWNRMFRNAGKSPKGKNATLIHTSSQSVTATWRTSRYH